MKNGIPVAFTLTAVKGPRFLARSKFNQALIRLSDIKRYPVEWASICVKHVLVHIGEHSNPSLIQILDIGKAWKHGKASVGDARNAAFAAITIANDLEDPVKISATRAVGHVVAVAHMADHSLTADKYCVVNECMEWPKPTIYLLLYHPSDLFYQ